jgi:hypothetical protein
MKKRHLQQWMAGLILSVGVIALAAPTTQPAPDALSQGEPIGAPRPTHAHIEAALDKPLGKELRFQKTHLRDAVTALGRQTDVSLVVRWKVLEAAGIAPDAEVTLDLRAVTLRQALRHLLDDASNAMFSLGFSPVDGVVLISTAADLERGREVVRMYDIADLVVAERQRWRLMNPMPQSIKALQEKLESTTRPVLDFNPGWERVEPMGDDFTEIIARLVTEGVDPESWRDNGGTIGHVRLLNGRLLITQTPENHAQIAQTLATLRRSVATTQPAGH